MQSDTATGYNFSRVLTYIMTFPGNLAKRLVIVASARHTILLLAILYGSHDERRGLLIMSIITVVVGAIAIQTFGN